jgi:FkbM family methyltransferase
MRIAFLDPIGWDYDPLTPLNRPLGGTQSAVAYLSAALARRGHEVAILNGARSPRRVEAVAIEPMEGAPLNRLVGLDAVVLLTGMPLPALQSLWPLAQTRTPLVLWQHSNSGTDAARYLADGRALASFDRIIGVSRWQIDTLNSELGIPAERMQVIGNAVATPFEALLSASADQPRSVFPTLAYSVTPFRGLDLLLEAWPQILQAVPNARLKIYSSMAMYQMAESEDPFRQMYDACRGSPGVDYIGALSQTDLAAALSQAWLFAYPSTYLETFCIGLIEAMAAGCHAVTTDLGALPETAMGHATLVPFEADRASLAHRFARATVDRLAWVARAPTQAADARSAQRASIAQSMVWGTRAQQWEAMIASLRDNRQMLRPAASPAANRVQTPAPNKLLVDGRHGHLLVDSRDAVGVIIARYGEWAEEELSRLMMLLRPGDRVIEVGAHVGSMTVGLAKAVGPDGSVHAFEPQQSLHSLLCANIALNGLDQVEPIRALVGGASGSRSLPAAANAPGNMGGVSFVGESFSATGGQDRVTQITLDEWFEGLDRLRLIKIDVEGMEPEVMSGAMRLIQRLRPIIQAECNSVEVFDHAARLADSLNYDLYWNGCRGFRPTNHFGETENLLGDMGDLNLLMIPRESELRLDVPPAFAFEDAGALFPGLLGAAEWRKSEPPTLPQAILPELITRELRSDAEESAGDFARFHQATQSIRFLRQHRDLIEAHHFGLGERGCHALWLELIRHRATAAPHQTIDLLGIGVFNGQKTSLWALIGRLLRLPLAIDVIAPLSGGSPADLFARCALDLRAVRVLTGQNQQPEIIAAKPAYDLIHIEGGRSDAVVRADLASFAPRVRPGGFLVLDDAALFPEASSRKGSQEISGAGEELLAMGFKHVLNVGRNRVAQRA